MEGRKILIHFSMKYKGDWDAIYKAVSTNEVDPEDEIKKSCAKAQRASKVITLLDDEYPEYLKRGFKPPFVLYYHGNLGLLGEDKNRYAFIGDRHLGVDGANRVLNAKLMMDQDQTLVTNLAIGTGAIACANQAPEKTIAVLGSGINCCYPRENQQYYEAIKEKGLLISEYPGTLEPAPAHFPMRNRIIGTISDVVVVAAMKQKNCGSMITVHHALEQNRDVYAVPSEDAEDYINDFINEGALPLLNKNSIQW